MYSLVFPKIIMQVLAYAIYKMLPIETGILVFSFDLETKLDSRARDACAVVRILCSPLEGGLSCSAHAHGGMQGQ